MIQRKQTLFLLIAVVLNFLCLIFPIGEFIPRGVGVNPLMYNLWIEDGQGSVSFASAPLFGILFLETIVSVVTIFRYNNRRQQIKFCSLNILLLVLWYITYAIVFSLNSIEDGGFKLHMVAVFPLISLIFTMMAKRGVKADEALIRAADRIR
ncbi:DUF4293 domain-containing protein [uncultured Prevotella sp.]|uniref:DUF4293 domain-containing protein n=1 Tax=uncultured Prevotella sp. TaxID=159272 RepID=UPI00261F57B0|nr:DUF4293 domain-containing protein [uncultured Prevotella sp.]